MFVLKQLIQPLLISAICLLAACKPGNSKTGNKADVAGTPENIQDARSIIAYNNVIVRLTDAGNGYIESLSFPVRKIEEGLEHPYVINAFYPLEEVAYHAPFYTETVRPENPPDAFGAEDKKFFSESVAKLNNNIYMIQASFKLLYNYIRAEDWKEDKGSKGKNWLTSIGSNVQQYYAAEQEILAKVQAMADSAENISLSANPLKKYILAIKNDNKCLVALEKLIESNAGNYKAGEAMINTAYASLEAQNQLSAAMDPADAAKYPYKSNAFSSFSTAVDNYLVNARRIMRNASANGKVAADDIEDLRRYQENVRSAYNNFMN